MELNIPPLRERREDILPLASQVHRRNSPKAARGFPTTVSDCLENYPWPGNVRELRNAMERAALLSRGELDFARTSARARARCRRNNCRQRREPAETPSGWRKSSGRPSCRRCASIISTARKPPRRWASAAARCFTNCSVCVSLDLKSIAEIRKVRFRKTAHRTSRSACDFRSPAQHYGV